MRIALLAVVMVSCYWPRGPFRGWVVQDKMKNMYIINTSLGLVVEPGLREKFIKAINKPVDVKGKVRRSDDDEPEAVTEVNEVRPLSYIEAPIQIELTDVSLGKDEFLSFDLSLTNKGENKIKIRKDDLYVVIIRVDSGRVIRGNSFHGEPGNLWSSISIGGIGKAKQRARFRLYAMEMGLRSGTYQLVITYGNLDSKDPCVLGRPCVLEVKEDRKPVRRERMPKEGK